MTWPPHTRTSYPLAKVCPAALLSAPAAAPGFEPENTERTCFLVILFFTELLGKCDCAYVIAGYQNQYFTEDFPYHIYGLNVLQKKFVVS